MKANDLDFDAAQFSDASLCMDHLDKNEDVTAESIVKALFEAFKVSRQQTRALDKLLLEREAELGEHIRALGVDATDDEVQGLVDQFGHSYCW
jgi:hypothetical protein